MTLQPTLSILQYNTRKSNEQVMMPLFDDPQTLSYDIIAIQEPWRNGEFWTTYHPHKNWFHLAYLENAHTRVCFFISKQIAQAEWYITNYSPDLCTLHLQIHPDRTVHIHNIYNPAPTTTNPRGCIPFLEEALSADRGGEHVVLGNFKPPSSCLGRHSYSNDRPQLGRPLISG